MPQNAHRGPEEHLEAQRGRSGLLLVHHSQILNNTAQLEIVLEKKKCTAKTMCTRVQVLAALCIYEPYSALSATAKYTEKSTLVALLERRIRPVHRHVGVDRGTGDGGGHLPTARLGDLPAKFKRVVASIEKQLFRKLAIAHHTLPHHT